MIDINLKNAYERAKEDILKSKDICKDNRLLYKEFFIWEEDKLNKINNLRGILDDRAYKTLIKYTQMIKNTNLWFNNKPLKNLTEQDIRRVYTALENGTLKNRFGKPIEDKDSYYNKIFKSKIFALAGKKEISEKVIEFYKPKEDEEIDFIIYEDFLKLVDAAIQQVQKLLLWLCYDYGENIDSMLSLLKKDFIREINKETKESEYRLNYRREILKRSRTKRSDYNNFKQTADLLEIILRDLNPQDKIFNFEYRQAVKFFDRAVKITKLKTFVNTIL